ncbi:3-carboxyethylcatechol 2,3-dioxygenase [Actinocorallia sp. A-T 12471]|uniref:3-carboxyethylcatechol 2,3-dioxygenase n=1 Tax=Actinocorallia sp. A-T 12471 TaxID=3089813 RepID=UPI0029D28C1D|nr:3-carboxyethylcatechol 2,3-dioxygenase [Actinocorallia sp. A-T 12471]MDX6740643.1 3-carboxyethylcatechol 2,3-dioxygenase [Actinocorallia sp. A-T 12471]
MPTALVCLSHSPLLGSATLPEETEAALAAALARAGEFVAEFDPTLVVVFAPDHYNGFFHELMPQYCVGLAASSVGDYGSAAGPLDVPAPVAEALVAHVLDDGVDVAFSRRMLLDHGAAQPLELLLGGLTARPVIPVFVNGVAPPFAPMRRVRLLGASIGRFLGGLGERVLVVGSGGLSHDPPVPRWAGATPEQAALLLAGRDPTPEARAAREGRVRDTARAFAAGTAPIRDLNPSWDERFLDLCAAGALAEADGWSPEAMTAEAGASSHEVRTWLAAFAALDAAGPYAVRDRFYRPIPELIAGFGVLTARTR